MIVRDWRDADAADTQWLYGREQDFWVRELAWDASSAWKEIEQARISWGLSGRIAIDEKRALRGWSYYMPDGETLHVGGIVADTIRATNALLDACLESAATPPRPARVSCFVPERAEGLEAALVERGFVCEHYHYLSRPLTPAAGDDAPFDAEGWRESDLSLAADLLKEAYGTEGRHFAPRGTLNEWEHYVRGLVERPGCGVLEPTITRIMRDGDIALALVLATRIAPGTIHLPQIAVHPSRRREGFARRLIDEACRAAAPRGARQATLLVGETNVAARELYAKMGFEPRATFIAATLEIS
ncbi:MAG TPA: N-acetyltransferase [Vicinamibacterales bacterium]|nr:N-acetyltransferase [Vicinamibacterales bacterium]